VRTEHNRTAAQALLSKDAQHEFKL